MVSWHHLRQLKIHVLLIILMWHHWAISVSATAISPNYHSHSFAASNINMAIKACAQEKSHLIRNREHMQMVKESLDEGYCDISGRTGDLNFIGSCRLFVDFHAMLMAHPRTNPRHQGFCVSTFVVFIDSSWIIRWHFQRGTTPRNHHDDETEHACTFCTSYPTVSGGL